MELSEGLEGAGSEGGQEGQQAGQGAVSLGAQRGLGPLGR